VNLAVLAHRVREGATVKCRPTGGSMAPLIRSGQEVEIAPVAPDRVEPDDIVLVRVAGRVYLHKVRSVEPSRRRARIGNNRGGVNGWVGFDRIYGICTSVDGVARPRADGKVRGPPSGQPDRR